MTSEELLTLVRTVPFVPFVLCSDAGDFPVGQPYLITHAPGTRTAAVSIGDGSIEFIDLLLVTGLVIAQQPAASSQG